MDLLGSSGGYWADLVPSTESSNLTSSADPVLGIGRNKLLPRLRITGQAGARAFRQTCGSSVELIETRSSATAEGETAWPSRTISGLRPVSSPFLPVHGLCPRAAGRFRGARLGLGSA